MAFQGPAEGDYKMAQNLTLSQRKVVLESFLSHFSWTLKSHF